MFSDLITPRSPIPAVSKRSDSSIALLTAAMPRPAALYNSRKWQLIGKSQWCCSANCGHPLRALTYNWTRGMQLENTPPPQSTTPGLHPVSFHQMVPPVRGNTHPITAYYSVYRPRKDERLSRPAWLVTLSILVSSVRENVCSNSKNVKSCVFWILITNVKNVIKSTYV